MTRRGSSTYRPSLASLSERELRLGAPPPHPLHLRLRVEVRLVGFDDDAAVGALAVGHRLPPRRARLPLRSLEGDELALQSRRELAVGLGDAALGVDALEPAVEDELLALV